MAEDRNAEDHDNWFSRRSKRSKLSIMSSDKEKKTGATENGGGENKIGNKIFTGNNKDNKGLLDSKADDVAKVAEIKVKKIQNGEDDDSDTPYRKIIEKFGSKTKDPVAFSDALDNAKKMFKDLDRINSESNRSLQSGWISAKEMRGISTTGEVDTGIRLRNTKEGEERARKPKRVVSFDEFEVHEFNNASESSDLGTSDYSEDDNMECICSDSYSDEDSLAGGLSFDSEDDGIDNENSSHGASNNFGAACSPVIREMTKDDVENLMILDNIKYLDSVQLLAGKNIHNFTVCALESYVLSFFGIVDFDKNLDFFDEKIKNLAKTFKVEIQTGLKKKHSSMEKKTAGNHVLKIVVYNRVLNSFKPEILKIDDYTGYFMCVSEIFTGLKDTKHIDEAFPEYGKKATSEPPKLIENIHLNKNYILKKRIGIKNTQYDVFLLDGNMMKQFVSAVYADCD